jgi:predicted metal-binding membrane protein
MTTVARVRPRPRTTAFAVTLGLAAACWLVALRRMDGMDMGVATRLGPLPGFLAGWAAMMAAMMLPGAAPAVARRVEQTGRLRAGPAFLAGYLTIWVLVGFAVGYELTPAKRHLRRCCQAGAHSGVRFGLCCLGSGLGLTTLLVALGVMSIGWMAVLGYLNLAQKLLPPRRGTDIPVALAVIGLGVLILLAPDWVPGLTPSM